MAYGVNYFNQEGLVGYRVGLLDDNMRVNEAALVVHDRTIARITADFLSDIIREDAYIFSRKTEGNK